MCSGVQLHSMAASSSAEGPEQTHRDPRLCRQEPQTAPDMLRLLTGLGWQSAVPLGAFGFACSPQPTLKRLLYICARPAALPAAMRSTLRESSANPMRTSPM